jgi:hypothetical protein
MMTAQKPSKPQMIKRATKHGNPQVYHIQKMLSIN